MVIEVMEQSLDDALARIAELEQMVEEATSIGLSLLTQLEVRDEERLALDRIRAAGRPGGSGVRGDAAPADAGAAEDAPSSGDDRLGTAEVETGLGGEHALSQVREDFLETATNVVERWQNRCSCEVDPTEKGVLIGLIATTLQSSTGNDPNWTGKVVYHCVQSIADALKECSGGQFVLEERPNGMGSKIVCVVQPEAIRKVNYVETDIAVMGGD